MIREVKNSGDMEMFISFPWKILGSDPNWVPPLRLAVHDLLNPKKHPFYLDASIQCFLFEENGQTLGRIAAIENRAHNKHHSDRVGFFGFFDCVDRKDVANELFSAAIGWLAVRGLNSIRGPVNPSTNYESGILIDGFDSPPFVMMTHNPKYYAALVENAGFRKSMDLYGYIIDTGKSRFAERLLKHSDRVSSKEGVTIRKIDMRRYDEESAKILELYNDAWDDNWGFVPMPKGEFELMSKEMKMILDPNLALMMDVRGELAGFGLAVPDVNQAQIKLRDGKLLPTGILRLLWNLKGPGKKRTIDQCRVMILGIRKKFRHLGLGPLFYTYYFRNVLGFGYRRGEASWILESNGPMIRALELMGAQKHKAYRIYERVL